MIERLQTHWYSYTKLALVYAMLFQVSFVFDFLWYDRTYSMLAYFFVFSCMMRVFLDRYKELVKLPLDVLLCFVIALIHSKRWPIYADQDLLTVMQKLLYTIADSWQFYSIGFTFLILARLIVAALHTRKQFTLFFSVGLIVMLIVDSFSPIVLWQHIITLLILFLLWHMCWHYEQIRKNNKDEFEVLLYNPFSIFTPFAVVISIALVIALIMPFGPPLLEDPYALWKKSRGEAVPAFLGDKGFKSLETTNAKSRQSGYSRSSAVLGGGFNFNYEPVLEITTPRKSYWRGETINYYNGEGWVDTTDNAIVAEIGPNVLFETKRPLAQTEEIDIQVKLLRDVPYPVLFHPSEPKMINEVVYHLVNSSLARLDSTHRYIEGPNQKIEQVIYNEQLDLPGVRRVDKDNTLTFDMNQSLHSYPVGYNIKADVIQLDVDQLILAEAKLEDPVLHEIYTALPQTIPQEVIDLAALITSQATSDYERAKLLEDYLKQNYAYSNQPKLDRISGDVDDFVYQFLFELYEGYCDYFSTAMAVMAKSLNMPTRWVKGFAPGVNLSEQYLLQIPMPYEDAERIKLDLSGGVYNVRNADAHSWIEIYFEGYGWIAFEPTPGFSYPYSYVSEEKAFSQTLNNEIIDSDNTIMSKQASSLFSATFITIGSIVLMLALAMLAWIRREHIKKFILSWRYKHLSNNNRIIYQFNAFLRYSKRRGLNRTETQTVFEGLKAWQHGSIQWKEQLFELYQLFEQARYSPRQLKDEQVKRVDELIKQLKRNWKV